MGHRKHRILQTLLVRCIGMILCCHTDPSGIQFQYRMVPAVMSEFQFADPCTVCEGKNLMSQTDSQDRTAPGQLPDGPHRLRHHFRIAGSVGDQHPVRRQCIDLRSRGIPGNNTHPASSFQQIPHNAFLHAAVDQDHMGSFRIRPADRDLPAADA